MYFIHPSSQPASQPAIHLYVCRSVCLSVHPSVRPSTQQISINGAALKKARRYDQERNLRPKPTHGATIKRHRTLTATLQLKQNSKLSMIAI